MNYINVDDIHLLIDIPTTSRVSVTLNEGEPD